MAIRPFPIDPKLTAIAIAYRNPDVVLIADSVLPRTPTSQEFKWLEYDRRKASPSPTPEWAASRCPTKSSSRPRSAPTRSKTTAWMTSCRMRTWRPTTRASIRSAMPRPT